MTTQQYKAFEMFARMPDGEFDAIYRDMKTEDRRAVTGTARKFFKVSQRAIKRCTRHLSRRQDSRFAQEIIRMVWVNSNP